MMAIKGGIWILDATRQVMKATVIIKTLISPIMNPKKHTGEHGLKLKGYYPYFWVQPFTFPSKYFATLQKGRGNFL
jgi:hypothetical protein